MKKDKNIVVHIEEEIKQKLKANINTFMSQYIRELIINNLTEKGII